jgi:hypothetical protein
MGGSRCATWTGEGPADDALHRLRSRMHGAPSLRSCCIAVVVDRVGIRLNLAAA